jgi:hypothetical protein
MLKHYHSAQIYKDNNILEHIRADTAGSAEMISKNKDKKSCNSILFKC